MMPEHRDRVNDTLWEESIRAKLSYQADHAPSHTFIFGHIYTTRFVEAQEAWVELGREVVILSQRLLVVNKMLSSFTLCTLHTGPMWPVLWFLPMSLCLETNIFWKASSMETLS